MSNKTVWTGAKVRQLRLELDMTQIEFAKMLDLPPGTIATVESKGSMSAALRFIFSAVAKATEEERKNLALAKEAISKALDKIKG